MRRWDISLITLLMLMAGKFLDMSAQNTSVNDCILNQIQDLEANGALFNPTQTRLGQLAESEINFQFDVPAGEACQAKRTFVRDGKTDRIGTVTFETEQPFTIGDLSQAFGTFKNYPTSPAGYKVAMAMYDSGNEQQYYAIIVQSKESLEADALLHKVVLRIDYDD